MRSLYIELIAISGVYLLTQLRVWVYILIRCFSRHGGSCLRIGRIKTSGSDEYTSHYLLLGNVDT